MVLGAGVKSNPPILDFFCSLASVHWSWKIGKMFYLYLAFVPFSILDCTFLYCSSRLTNGYFVYAVNQKRCL